MRSKFILRAAVVAVLVAAPAFADEQAVRGYLDQAKQLADDKDFEGAKAKLELAEAELDGVTGGGKQPLADRIAEMRAKITADTASADRPKYQRKLDNVMREAEDAIGNLVTWSGAESATKELFDDPAAKAALGDDLAKAQKKFATFKRLNDKKAEVQLSAAAEENVKAFEAAWATNKPKIVSPATPGEKDTAVTDMDHEITNVRRTLQNFPPDSPALKGFNDRIDKIANEYTSLALADQVKEKTTRLAEGWDSYKDEWTGWEAEKTGPTLADYTGHQGGAMSALNAPKTAALISRATSWLKDLKTDEDYQKFASSPAIKAIVDKITADKAAAQEKMAKFAGAILTEAEAKKPMDPNTTDAIGRLADGLANNVGEGDALVALTARATALTTGVADAKAAKTAGAEAFYKDATAKAAADWPAMKAKYTTADGFDPAAPADFKGKLIVLETDNLMGFKFKPGDFAFATTLNGIPLAAKYDPAVAKAVREIETKLGRGLGDDDNDGKWEIIARVTGQTGKLTKKVAVEGELKDTAGNTARVTDERAETVDAPILTIVAAHCGPLAAANGETK